MDESTVKDEMTVPDALLSALERSFEEAMEVLEGDDNLGRFRLEYEKLYRALQKSHESEKQLVVICQELTQELLSNAAKMQAAVKLSQGDHSTIEALKKETEKAWRTVDSANDKDLRAKETIKSLKKEIASLRDMVEKGAALTTDHTSTLEELKLEKKRLQVLGEELSKQVDTFTSEIEEMSSGFKKSEAEVLETNEEMQRVADRFDIVKQEYRRERNACERAELQSRENLLVLQTRENELGVRVAHQEALDASVIALENQLRDQQERKQALLLKTSTFEQQLFHTQQSHNDCVDTTSDLQERLQSIEKSIREVENGFKAIGEEQERVVRVTDNDFKELVRLQQQNTSISRDLEGLESQRNALERRIASMQEEKNDLHGALDALVHERDVLRKRGEREKERCAATEKLIQVEKEKQAELEDSIRQEAEIRGRMKSTAAHLEKERGKCVEEASHVHIQHLSAKEELKMAILTVEETQRKIEEREMKLNEQQAKYERVRTERNQYSKKLVEAQDEIVELKQSFKMMDHQILQFKDELAMKEKKHQEEIALQKHSKERITKSRKLVNEQIAAFDEAKKKSETVSQQIKQLVKVIAVCDKELSEQQKQFLKVSHERDLLGAQLIRRNDELAVLYEKLRIQNETLTTGETEYRARQEDIRVLRLKIAEVGRQSTLAHTRAFDVQVVKNQLREMERTIATEQVKIAALTEELENPKNTSRWRKIEGADLSPEDLEKKIRFLQERLILMSEKSLECEMALQEKDCLATELRALLARQPGPEVARQLNAYHKDLTKKNARMKQKASELNMTSTHIAELKYESERLRQAVHEMKRRYYEVHLKNDLALRQQRPVEGST